MYSKEAVLVLVLVVQCTYRWPIKRSRLSGRLLPGEELDHLEQVRHVRDDDLRSLAVLGATPGHEHLGVRVLLVVWDVRRPDVSHGEPWGGTRDREGSVRSERLKIPRLGMSRVWTGGSQVVTAHGR